MMEIFYFDGTGKKAKAQDLDKVKGWPIWIDITGITKKEAEAVRAAFDLHPLTAEDLLNINTRIKVEVFPHYLFCAFYTLRTTMSKSKPIALEEMDFVLGERFLISSHTKDISGFTELKNNPEQLEQLFHKGLDFVMHRLLDQEVDNYFPVLHNIDDQIEDIEEEVTGHPRHPLLLRILVLKRLIVLIKKVALPQREKISVLAQSDLKFISRKAVPYFRDVYDHAVRVADTIDNYRESIGNTFDVYMSALSNHTNEVVKVLSIMATLALPM